MPLFICRWHNGDVSALNACSRQEAILLLNELGRCEIYEVFRAKDLMVHFHLNTGAKDRDPSLMIEVEGVGEEMPEILCERVYPIYEPAGDLDSELEDAPRASQ